jgi:hypothetical protein
MVAALLLLLVTPLAAHGRSDQPFGRHILQNPTSAFIHLMDFSALPAKIDCGANPDFCAKGINVTEKRLPGVVANVTWDDTPPKLSGSHELSANQAQELIALLETAVCFVSATLCHQVPAQSMR